MFKHTMVYRILTGRSALPPTMCVGVRLLTVATLRRKVRMLSVISGAAAHPSSADKGGAGGWKATSHGRNLLTIHLVQTSRKASRCNSMESNKRLVYMVPNPQSLVNKKR